MPLLDLFDKAAKTARCPNRSAFFRSLMRDHLAKEEWTGNGEVLGTITLVYNHRRRQLAERLADLQSRCRDCIMASMQVHLDENIRAEVILAKGQARRIQETANLFRQQKGVIHVSLSMSSTGKPQGTGGT
jgi:CopG family nickel-responsive transcriptional regulator